MLTGMRATVARLRAALTRRVGRIGPTDGAAAATARLADLTAARRHDEASAFGREALDRFPTHQSLVRQVRQSAAKAGAMTLLWDATEIQAARWPTPDLLARQRQQLGRLRETSADWWPSPGEVAPITERQTRRVVHVLKISMPHRQSGYSVRGQYALAAQREVGWDPVGVTALDFPRSIGTADAAEQEDVGGVRHRRVLRDEIPEGEPVDDYLDAWAQRLAAVVAEERPEILQAHSGHRGYETALVTLAVGRATGIPVVYEVRGFFESLWTSDVDWAERSETYERRRATETRCMLAADAVVTLSESMRADIVDRGVPAERVHVVPNGVDADAFSPRPRSSDLAARWGLTGRFVFGYVSNLDHYREGHELLVDAAAAYRARGIDAVALIVGDGSRAAALKDRAVAAGVEDRVVFTGKVPHDEVLDYYGLYDAFVIPRVNERAARLVTPLKPFEAMAAGVPLVVSALPALTEITGDGDRGLSFAVGDAEDLVECLEQVRTDPEGARDRVQRALTWVRDERSWRSNGQRYADIYRVVLDGAGQSSAVTDAQSTGGEPTRSR